MVVEELQVAHATVISVHRLHVHQEHLNQALMDSIKRTPVQMNVGIQALDHVIVHLRAHQNHVPVIHLVLIKELDILLLPVQMLVE
jgi:hypothetical protein